MEHIPKMAHPIHSKLMWTQNMTSKLLRRLIIGYMDSITFSKGRSPDMDTDMVLVYLEDTLIALVLVPS